MKLIVATLIANALSKLPELEEIVEQTSQTAGAVKQVTAGVTTGLGPETLANAAPQVSAQPAASSDDQK